MLQVQGNLLGSFRQLSEPAAELRIGAAEPRPGPPDCAARSDLPISYRSSAISSDAITSMRASPLCPAAALTVSIRRSTSAAIASRCCLLAVLAADGVCIAVDANGNLRHRMILASEFNRPCRQVPRADDRSNRRVAQLYLPCPRRRGCDDRCARPARRGLRNTLQRRFQSVGRRFRVVGIAGHLPAPTSVPREQKAGKRLNVKQISMMVAVIVTYRGGRAQSGRRAGARAIGRPVTLLSATVRRCSPAAAGGAR